MDFHFYHVTIEADGLVMSDDTIGFVANRYLISRSPELARTQAVANTLRVWTTGRLRGASARPPSITASEVRQIGLFDFLQGRPQNQGHVFYGPG